MDGYEAAQKNKRIELSSAGKDLCERCSQNLLSKGSVCERRLYYKEIEYYEDDMFGYWIEDGCEYFDKIKRANGFLFQAIPPKSKKTSIKKDESTFVLKKTKYNKQEEAKKDKSFNFRKTNSIKKLFNNK